MKLIKRSRRYRALLLPLLLSVLAACSYEGESGDGAAEVSESGGISDWKAMAEKASEESLAKRSNAFSDVYGLPQYWGGRGFPCRARSIRVCGTQGGLAGVVSVYAGIGELNRAVDS